MRRPQLRLTPLAAVALVVALAAGACQTTSGEATASPDPTATPAPTATAAPIATPAPTARPSPNPTAAPVREGPGEPFTDPDGGYVVNIDPDWVAAHGAIGQGIEIWFIGPEADDLRPNVNILTQEVGDLTLEAYNELSVEGAPMLIPDFDVVSSDILTGTNGTRLARWDYTGTPTSAGQKLHFLGLFMVHDGQAIVVTMTATLATFEDYRAAVEPYLLTLTPAD